MLHVKPPFYFVIGLMSRAKWMWQLGTSWLVLNRVNTKVTMKWATVKEEEGVNILLKYVVVFYGDFSYKYTHCLQ